jgi:D-alanyl-D-alanine carboxypeptidase
MGRRRLVVGTAVAVALAVTMVGCQPDPSTDARTSAPATGPTAAVDSTSPTALAAPPTTVPAPAPPATSPWIVGARPLPLRSDGFGQVLPTPEVLRDRRLPTVDQLPSPLGAAFTSTVQPVPDEVLRRSTWRAGCPVRVDQLRYLTMSFWGFDGRHHTGEMIVNARVAADVVSVFGTLHAARFPLEEMRVVNAAELDAPPTGDSNNTTAFVCRPARGQTRWSAHAYGLAVDVNPFCNPYLRRDLVLPELASAYLDRGWVRPGMIRSGHAVVRAFAAIGWTWGGTWSSPRDQMHFSATGT